MSERKTSEIKLRVTPSFKASVQLAAEQAGETMSVYMETATEGRMNQEQQVSVSILPETVRHAISGKYDVVVHPGSILDTPVGPSRFPTAPNPVTPVATGAADPKGLGTLGDVKFVPAESDKVACEKKCPSWVWCECKQAVDG